MTDSRGPYAEDSFTFSSFSESFSSIEPEKMLSFKLDKRLILVKLLSVNGPLE